MEQKSGNHFDINDFAVEIATIGRQTDSIIVGVYSPRGTQTRWLRFTSLASTIGYELQQDEALLVINDISQQLMLEHELGERKKELSAFYAISEIIEQRGASQDQVCQQLIDLLPRSWQYPEDACGRIVVNEKQFCSKEFVDTEWALSAPIIVSGKKIGEIDIFYHNVHGEGTRSLFLPEEHSLIQAIAERLGRYLERTRANEELKYSQMGLRQAQQMARLGHWQMDLQTEKVFWSDGLFELLKLDPLKVNPSRDLFFQFIHPGDRERVLSIINAMGLTHNSYDVDYRMILQDGSQLFVRTFSTTTFDSAGNPLKVFGVIQDITKEKETERELGEALSFMQNAEKQTGLGGWTYEPITGKAWWSPQMFTLFNFDPKDGIPSPTEYVALVHPGDRAKLQEAMTLMTHGELPSEYEFRTNPERGISRTIQARYSAIRDANGKIVKYIGTSLDVTALRKNESRIRQLNTKYKLIADNTDDVIWVMDWNSLAITFMSPSVYKLRGYLAEEVVGQTLTDLLTPETRQGIEKIIAQLKQDFSQWRNYSNITFEAEMMCKNGLTVPVEVIANLTIDDDGVPQIVGVTRNISERKKAGKALNDLLAKYQLVSENTGDMIWIRDIESNQFSYISPSAQHTLGYTPEEAIRLGLDQLLVPDSIQNIRGIVEKLMDEAKSGNINPRISFDIEQYRKDGSIITCETSVSLVKNENGKNTLIGITRDISDRKRAEREINEINAKYRLVSENSGDVIWIWDVEAKHYTYVSPSVIHVHGITPEETLKMDVNQVLTPASYQKVAGMLAQNISEVAQGRKAPQITLELDQYRKDGSIFPTETSISLVKDEAGRLVIVGMSRDISARKAAEEQLHLSQMTYQAILDATAESVFLITVEGTILSTNKVGANRLHKEPQELIGKNIFKLFPPKLAKSRKEALFTMLVTKTPVIFEDEREGMHFRLAGYPIFDAEGNVQQIAVYADDITESYRSQQALRQSEETSRVLVQASEDSVLLLDAKGNILLANEVFAARVGYSLSEIIGKHFLETIQGPAARVRKLHFEKVMRDKQPETWEFSEHGESFQAHVVPILDGSGQVVQVAIYTRNITTLLAAEQEKRDHIADLTLINSVNEAINQGMDVQGITTIFAQNLKENFAISEFILMFVDQDGKSLTTIEPGLPDRLQRLLKKTIHKTISSVKFDLTGNSQIASVLLNGVPQLITDPDQLFNERKEFLQASDIFAESRELFARALPLLRAAMLVKSEVAIPLISEGRPIGLLTLPSNELLTENEFNRLTAITTQLNLAVTRIQTQEAIRESNQRFEQLVNTIPEGFWIFDSVQRRFVFISPGIETIWGVTRQALYQAPELLHDLILPEYLPMLNKNHKLQLQGQAISSEFRIRRADGAIRWISEREIPMLDKQGRLVQVIGTHTDITEMKMNEQLLNENEAFLESIIKSSPGDIFSVDLESHFIYTNRRWPSESDEAFHASRFLEEIHIDQREFAEALFQKAISSQSSESLELRKRMPDGKYRWWQVEFFPVVVDGKVERVTIFTFDIQERKEAEHALRKSEETQHAFLGAISESAWLLDVNGNVLLANQTALERFHTTAEQILNYELYSIMPAEVAALGRARIIEAIDTQRPVKFEDVREGRTYLNSINPILDEHGNVIQLAIFGVDITELRQKEEENLRLSHVVDQMADTVMITDANGIIEYVNPAFERITGYSLQDVVGKKPNLLKSGKLADSFYRQLWQTILSGKVFEAEFPNRKKNGELFYEIKTITPVLDANGNIVNFIGTGKDISDRIVTEEAPLR